MEKKSSKGKKGKKYQAIAWVIVILILIVLLLAGGVAFLTQSGKNRLRQNAVSAKPDIGEQLAKEETKQEELLPDDTVWEDDWVTYNGQVYDYNEDILTFLCMGVDVNSKVKDTQKGLASGQADALFLLVLNPDIKKINIIAIDRNTMADFDVYDEQGNYKSTQYGQITLAHAYGDGKELSAENTLKAVSALMYNIPIHGYCAINMGAIGEINDAVGGVDVTVLQDLTAVDKSLKKGELVHLKGKQAYYYVQHRDTSVEESARMRLNRQKQYLTAYIAKAKEAFKQDVTLPVTLFNKLTPYMITDITLDEVVYLAGQAAGYSFSSDNMYTIPGSTDTGNRFEEFYPDEAGLKDLIMEIFYTPVGTK